MAQDKLVSVRFIDGDPCGIKVCTSPLSKMTTLCVPRGRLAKARHIDLPKRGVYYLLGCGSHGVEKAYVGQTRQGIDRLNDHNQRKIWWDTAVLFLSDDNRTFSLEILSALEKHGIDMAVHSLGSRVENIVDPRYVIQPEDKPIVDALYSEMLFMLKALGFEPAPLAASDAIQNETRLDFAVCERLDEPQPAPSEHLDQLKQAATSRASVGASGRVPDGTYVLEQKKSGLRVLMDVRDGQYTLREGQRVNQNPGKGLSKGVIGLRQRYINGDGFVRAGLPPFKTPSGASDFVLGHSSNGWVEWKTIQPIDGEPRTLSYFRDLD